MSIVFRKVLLILSLILISGAYAYSKQPFEIKGVNLIFKKHNVNGSILILDSNNNQYMGYNLD